MDLRFRRRNAGVPSTRCASSWRPTRTSFPDEVLRHRRGIRAAPALGQGAFRRRTVRDHLAAASTAAATRPCCSGWSTRRSTSAPARPGRASANGTSMLAPTLFAHGTEEQLDRILPKMASGEEIWAQAWSEPESGSDLASLRSTATRTDGGWLLNGQKIWSSRAPFGDRAFGLFRSDPEAAAPPRADVFHVRPEGRRDHGAADRPTRRRHRLRGDLPRRRLRARRGRDRRGARRLARRDEHVEQRARHVAAQPGALPGRRGTTRRAVEGQRHRQRVRRSGRRRLDQGAGLPAAHLRHRDPAGRRR